MVLMDRVRICMPVLSTFTAFEGMEPASSMLMLQSLPVQIPTVLVDLWKLKSAEQKSVIALCQAAAAGKIDEMNVRCMPVSACCAQHACS